MMKGLYEHQQQTKKITPLLPISLALEPISVTNNDNIIVSDNNNGITYNNDNPSGTELLEQNGNKNVECINNSLTEKSSIDPQLQYRNPLKDDDKMITSLSSEEAAVINARLDSRSSATSSHNDSSHFHNRQRSIRQQTSLNTSSSATNSTITHTYQSKKSPKKCKRQLNYSRPPDGGWGWMVVFASFIINLIADGVSLSFGVIYVELVNYFNESKGKTAWIGSLFLSIPLLTGPIGSSLVDRFGCRKVTIAGSLLASLGFFLGQFATCVEHLFFAFSLAGFGLALDYVTSIVSVAYWFDRRRSLATGLAVCGSGFGTFLFAPFMILLLKEYGWRGTLLILSGVFLNMVWCGLLIPDVNIDTSGDISTSSSSSNSQDISDSDSDLSDSVDNLDYDDENDRPKSITDNWSQEPHRLSLKQHSVREKPLLESNSIDDSFPRHTSSLINIPTFIKNNNDQNSSTNNKNEMQSNNKYRDLTFRRGGYLHNLICHYPHLLSMFLQCDMQCDDLTVKTKVILQSNMSTVPLTPPSPVPPKPIQKVVEFGSTHHMDSHTKLNGFIQNDGDTKDSNDVSRNEGILKSSSDSRQNNTTSRFGNLLNFTRQSQHIANNNDVLFNSHQQNTSHVNRLHHLRLPRGSLTYRSAMLVINKYRLKASSAPDIYRTSMVTINEEKSLNFFENLKEIFVNMIDISIFKSFRYSIFCLSNFLLYVCIDVPYVYIPDQVITSGASDKDHASQYISIIGIFNIFGVIFVGYIGDKPWLDASFIYAILVSISGLMMAALPLTTDSLLLSIESALYGFCISANYSLVSVILVELISLDSFTTAYGMLLLVEGFGSLIGPPVAGWIFDVSGSYDNAFYITGITILLSGILVLPVGRKKNCFIWRKRSDDKIEKVLKDKNLHSSSDCASSPSCEIKIDNKHSNLLKTRAISTVEKDSEF